MKNPLQWAIQQNNESLVVTLSGTFSRNTLQPLWQQRASFLLPKANQTIYWDLKNLDEMDSAGFALFAELLNTYQRNNPICLMNVPEFVKNLAELYDLSDWFTRFIYGESKN